MDDEVGALTQIVDHHRREHHGKPTDSDRPKTEVASKSDRFQQSIEGEATAYRDQRTTLRSPSLKGKRRLKMTRRMDNGQWRRSISAPTDVGEAVSLLSNQVDHRLIGIERFQDQRFGTNSPDANGKQGEEPDEHDRSKGVPFDERSVRRGRTSRSPHRSSPFPIVDKRREERE